MIYGNQQNLCPKIQAQSGGVSRNAKGGFYAQQQ
jgi:hypothetical protein